MTKTKKTLTRSGLYQAVYRKVGLSHLDSARLVESVFDTIIEAIAQGKTLKISSFATFEVRNKKQRIGRNPRTGELVPIMSRKVLSFRPSIALKKKINDSHNKRTNKPINKPVGKK